MKLAYLVSRYPAVSHTFIMHEVQTLREAGIEVQTFTIRRVPKHQLLTQADRAEYDRTASILPAGLGRLLKAHLTMILTRFRHYGYALYVALKQRPPGWRSALWQLFYFAEAAVLACELRRQSIHHVHVHFANVAANVARLAAEMGGVRWSLTLHGLSDFGNPARSRLQDKIHSAALVVCVCDFGRSQAMLQSDPCDWGKIHRVYCGIDTARFIPTPANTKEEPGGGPLRLLTVGRLGPEKGHALLLEALRQVHDRDMKATLTIVGDGPERSRLQRMVDKWQLGEHVTLAGAVGQEELPAYYDHADVFVLASLYEGLPVVLMEAMAKQLPVIATRITGIPELVEHHVCGLLVPPGRVDAMADAILELAADPHRRDELGRQGRQRVCRNFEHRRCAESLVRLLEEQRTSDASAALCLGVPAALRTVKR